MDQQIERSITKLQRNVVYQSIRNTLRIIWSGKDFYLPFLVKTLIYVIFVTLAVVIFNLSIFEIAIGSLFWLKSVIISPNRDVIEIRHL